MSICDKCGNPPPTGNLNRDIYTNNCYCDVDTSSWDTSNITNIMNDPLVQAWEHERSLPKLKRWWEFWK